MIKVIAFDYAQVIAEGPMFKWGRALPPETKNKLNDYKKHADLWDRGKMTIEEINKVISELTGIKQEHLWEKFYDVTTVNAEVITLINKLKINNYKVILFSNFVAERLRQLLDKFGITGLFDEIVISSDYGLQKPDPKFFDILVEKAGVEKQEIFFTDDSLKNIEGAKEYGIKAYQFTTCEQLIKDLRSEGVTV